MLDANSRAARPSAARRQLVLALALFAGACASAPTAQPGLVPHAESAATAGERVGAAGGTGVLPGTDPTATARGPADEADGAATTPSDPAAAAQAGATTAAASALSTARTASPAPPAAAGFDPSAIALVLDPAWSGFAKPVLLVGAGDGSGRRFVVEQAGRVQLIAGGDVRQGPYLDIRDRVGSRASEQGLLGLAFHPQFAENGRLFVHYTDRDGDTVVSELRAVPDAETVDPTTERVLLTADQPATNHNGGHVVFGPDGMLYIGLGDGGGANDTYGNGQRPDTLLGKILRIDVDAGAPYAVPPDNPLLEGHFAPETWAWGLRNPWRFAFDRATGDLYIGDVGQGAWEEIDVAPASSRGGENYGWPILEGGRCLGSGDPPAACGAGADLVMPVAIYPHPEGCSVTGGHVYRGPDQPAIEGVYLYGDYCSGRIWGLWRAAGGTWQAALLDDTDLAISSFGEDDDGVLYVLDHGGTVLRVGAQSR